MRTILLLASIGCASSGALRTVDEAHWRSVPVQARDATAAEQSATMKAALEERRLAEVAVEEAKKALAGHETKRQQPSGAVVDDEAQRKYDAAIVRARAHIDESQREALRADLTWRERRLDAATARLTLVRAEGELDRAHLVDHNIASSEGFDVSPFRGQVAREQAAWSHARKKVDRARAEKDRWAQAVIAAKEAYASLCRQPPSRTPKVAAKDDQKSPPPRVARK
jgi:hypothetical protein